MFNQTNVLSGWWKCENPDCDEPHNVLVVGSYFTIFTLLQRMGFDPADTAPGEDNSIIVKTDESYLTVRKAQTADSLLERMMMPN